MMTPVLVADDQEFEFFTKIGADQSMIDYAKMSILFASQKKFDTIKKIWNYRKNRKKFEEKYGGSCAVSMFQDNLRDLSACFDQYCLCSIYNNAIFIIIIQSKYSNLNSKSYN